MILSNRSNRLSAIFLVAVTAAAPCAGRSEDINAEAMAAVLAIAPGVDIADRAPGRRLVDRFPADVLVPALLNALAERPEFGAGSAARAEAFSALSSTKVRDLARDGELRWWIGDSAQVDALATALEHEDDGIRSRVIGNIHPSVVDPLLAPRFFPGFRACLASSQRAVAVGAIERLREFSAAGNPEVLDTIRRLVIEPEQASPDLWQRLTKIDADRVESEPGMGLFEQEGFELRWQAAWTVLGLTPSIEDEILAASRCAGEARMAFGYATLRSLRLGSTVHVQGADLTPNQWRVDLRTMADGPRTAAVALLTEVLPEAARVGSTQWITTGLRSLYDYRDELSPDVRQRMADATRSVSKSLTRDARAQSELARIAEGLSPKAE